MSFLGLGDPVLLGMCLMAGGILTLAAGWWVSRVRKAELDCRRAQAHQLADALRAYSAWMDCQRGDTFMAMTPDELATPEPLERARRIKDESFPELSSQMVKLLLSHGRMTEYLWQQNILRITQPAPLKAIWQDEHYQALRDRQEDMIDRLIYGAQELVGQVDSDWHSTRTSDFGLSSSLHVPRHRTWGAH